MATAKSGRSAGGSAVPPLVSTPLEAVSVIVCRPADDAASLIQRLANLGAEPVVVPLHERDQPTDGGAGLRQALADLGSFDWVAVTSANGARALLENLVDRAWPGKVRLAAVGPATARLLTAAGLTVDLVASPSTAVDLARSFPAAHGPSRVLAPLSEAADHSLSDGLTARGYLVERVDAYRMRELSVDETQADAVASSDAVLFSAPSVVDRFVDRFSRNAVPPIVITIGPRTSARAHEQGIEDVIEAVEHTEEGLIAALLATLTATNR